MALARSIVRSLEIPHPADNPLLTADNDHFRENNLTGLHDMQNVGHIP